MSSTRTDGLFTLKASKIRFVTADFGAVREMESLLLGAEVIDQETEKELVVQTPAHANFTGLIKEEMKGSMGLPVVKQVE
jgi:hypothetical protein